MQNNQSKHFLEYHNLIQIYERNVIKYHQLEIRSNSNELIQKYANDRKLSKLAAKFPLLKILKMVIRKFMLNDLEILIFIYLLDKLEWNYSFFLPENHILPDFIINVEVQDYKEYHSLNLYCICVAYFTKNRLNQEMNIYDCYFQQQIQNFNQIYEKWEFQFKNYLQINLIDMNKIHMRFQVNLNDNFEYNFDYNALVDSIIQISPPNKGQKLEQPTQQKIIQDNFHKNEIAFINEDSNSLNNFNDNRFIEEDNLYSDQFCFSQQ